MEFDEFNVMNKHGYNNHGVSAGERNGLQKM